MKKSPTAGGQSGSPGKAASSGKAKSPSSTTKPASSAKPGPSAKTGPPTKSKPGPAASSVPAASSPPDIPKSVMIAVRLMYAGAVVTAIVMVISVIAAAAGLKALRASHPHATAAHLHSYQTALITSAIVFGLIEIAMWLIMARTNRAGAKWARMAATVLFVFATWNFVGVFLGKIKIIGIAYSGVTWLVGLAAIVYLWQRTSGEYFTAQAALLPDPRRRRELSSGRPRN
jgi:hypothetical protein